MLQKRQCRSLWKKYAIYLMRMMAYYFMDVYIWN